MSLELTTDFDFDYCLTWLRDEREYTLKKLGSIEKDYEHVKEWVDTIVPEDAWWFKQLDNYLHRSFVLGLDTPNGRQALAKFVSTALGFLSATVEVYGPLPEPGVSSGDNLDKLRPRV